MKLSQWYCNNSIAVTMVKLYLIVTPTRRPVMMVFNTILFTLMFFLQHLAESLHAAAISRGLKTSLVDLKDYEPEDNLAEEVRLQYL